MTDKIRANIRPIDFLVFDSDSCPNIPAYKITKAMMKPIIIRGPSDEFAILSYYMTEDGMVLDIKVKPRAGNFPICANAIRQGGES